MSLIDLSAEDLTGADLRGRDLAGAQLAGKNLARAVLAQARLQGADLSGADLRNADLTDADLSNANLQGANLAGANVTGANLHRALVDTMFAGMLSDYAGTPNWTSGSTAPSLPSSAPAQFQTATGQPVRCTQCGGETFRAQDVLLNTRGLTFLGLDWLNRSVAALGCNGCGHVEFFAKPVSAR